jgi:hypothetical protein
VVFFQSKTAVHFASQTLMNKNVLAGSQEFVFPAKLDLFKKVDTKLSF